MMRLLLFSLFGLIFLTTFTLILGQESSFDDQLVSSEEYTKLVTTNHDLENRIIDTNNKIESLENINSELNRKIENLTIQIDEIKDHGIKFGIDEEKLGNTISNNLKNTDGWSEGDVLVGSTTIFAFFTFSSLLVIRFQSKFRKQLVRITRDILLATGGIQLFQILIIGSIVLNKFDGERYAMVLFGTMSMLVIILTGTYRIIKAENTIDKRKEESMNISRELKSEITAHGIDSIEILNRLNAVERENKRIRQELGE